MTTTRLPTSPIKPKPQYQYEHQYKHMTTLLDAKRLFCDDKQLVTH